MMLFMVKRAFWSVNGIPMRNMYPYLASVAEKRTIFNDVFNIRIGLCFLAYYFKKLVKVVREVKKKKDKVVVLDSEEFACDSKATSLRTGKRTEWRHGLNLINIIHPQRVLITFLKSGGRAGRSQWNKTSVPQVT
ncbi:hypothetical protein AVEN_43484-1 [Araneus ventricosus]|uniref:Uncharacterized protein n=1 Tax=Araneus ventricosus TaxID=182803 RepID=A0A4Y2GTD2_ARAVE|nr:hypothetical protein AVEN_43484-1 [Araneus ventricosus]